MTLSALDDPTRALIALAAAIAVGHGAAIEEHGRTCLAEGAPETWVDELLLQSTLMVGWPRSLAAAAIWRRIAGPARPVEDGTDYGRAAEWRARGDAVCRVVYGSNYERLRANIQALHPALDAWMVTEGYGRTLGRPGLDLARRELHSHLKGALNAGVTAEALAEALEIVKPMLGLPERAVLASLWERMLTS